jgi:hypothetical protein
MTKWRNEISKILGSAGASPALFGAAPKSLTHDTTYKVRCARRTRSPNDYV